MLRPPLGLYVAGDQATSGRNVVGLKDPRPSGNGQSPDAVRGDEMDVLGTRQARQPENLLGSGYIRGRKLIECVHEVDPRTGVVNGIDPFGECVELRGA